MTPSYWLLGPSGNQENDGEEHDSSTRMSCQAERKTRKKMTMMRRKNEEKRRKKKKMKMMMKKKGESGREGLAKGNTAAYGVDYGSYMHELARDMGDAIPCIVSLVWQDVKKGHWPRLAMYVCSRPFPCFVLWRLHKSAYNG